MQLVCRVHLGHFSLLLFSFISFDFLCTWRKYLLFLPYILLACFYSKCNTFWMYYYNIFYFYHLFFVKSSITILKSIVSSFFPNSLMRLYCHLCRFYAVLSFSHIWDGAGRFSLFSCSCFCFFSEALFSCHWNVIFRWINLTVKCTW